VDRWFLNKLKNLIDMEQTLRGQQLGQLTREVLLKAKKLGFNDHHLAELVGAKETEVRALRKEWKITPVYKMVDTCAGEFEAETPYYYSCYELESE
jgi:carbamoyl-phosphate synthase large subunit